MCKGSLFFTSLPHSSLPLFFFIISLMISDAEHLYMYLLTICISSLEKCLFRLFVHFKIGLHGLFLLSCTNFFLYILDINLFLDIGVHYFWWEVRVIWVVFPSTWGSLVSQLVKNPPTRWETWVQSLSWEDPLEKGMAIHASILAWRIPWTI